MTRKKLGQMALMIVHTTSFLDVRKAKIGLNLITVIYKLMYLWLKYEEIFTLRLANHINKQEHSHSFFLLDLKLSREIFPVF